MRGGIERGATVIAFLMVAQQVAGKAARDGFFLATHTAAALPAVMTAAAGLGFVLVLLSSRVLVALSPRRATPLVFAFNGAAFLVEAWLAGPRPDLAATVTYLHTGAFAGIVASAFWSNMNERFDPHHAKRAFATINLGSTAGGVAGGVLAWLGARSIDVPQLLLALAAVNLACAIGFGMMPPDRPPPRAPAPPAPRERLFAQGYLVLLAGIVVLVTAADTLVEFAFKASASRHFDDADMLPFFSLFYAATGVATFALQASLSGRLLVKVGLSGAAAVLPAATLAGAALALVAPGFASALVVRAASLTTEHSIFRSAYELAYTPLPPERKRRLKAYIDVGLNRLAAVLAGGVTMLMVSSLTSEQIHRALMVLVLVAATATLYLTRALKEGYRSALEASLRSGVVALSPGDVVDADTRHSFGGALVLDRQAILAQAAAMDEHDHDHGAPARARDDEDRDRFAARRRQLRSGSPAAIREALAGLSPVPRELVGDVIPLLGFDPVLPEVLAVLRGSADRHAGVLTDALLDPESPPEVRRRLPRVLQASSSRRAIEGLLEAIGDEHLEVRLWAGAALVRVRLHLAGAPLPIDEARVLAAIRRELAGEEPRRSQRDDLGDAASLAQETLFPAPARGWWLVHVFNLLSLLFDPEIVGLAYAAVGSSDRRLHGTGLEYLEVMLPAEVAADLVALVAVPERPPRRVRAPTEVRQELLASREALPVPHEALRALGRDPS